MRASLNQNFTLDDKCCLLFLLLKTQIGVLKDVKEEIRRLDRKSRKDLNLMPSVLIVGSLAKPQQVQLVDAPRAKDRFRVNTFFIC